LLRFEREAYAASALNHPNILTIYEIGETDSAHFIATEYIEGETLREALTGSSINLKVILEIAIQTANALDAAHRAGIVHRDIKPENVMIRPDGLVKILDFGIAKLTEKQNEADSEAPTAISAQTTPGMIIGTANYMSPEQARGKAVDARSDIFSFGVVLYEMLAGKSPFDGENALDVIGSILNKEPAPWSEAETPRELQRIVEKCLRKDREERYQTARDLLIDLKDVKQDLEFQNKLERTASPHREESKTQLLSATTSDVANTTSSAEYVVSEIKQHKRGFVFGLIILFLTVVGFGYWFFGNRPSNLTNIESIAVMPFVNESGNADNEYLSDGMTESLISSLSQLPKLSVKARSSVFRYKGKDVNPQNIGNELDVQAVLLGRVIQRAEQLILSLELVDVRTENIIWSEQYNRKQTDLVSLQSEIARDVSNKLRAKLSGADEQKVAKNYTENTEAYQLYLRGRYHWNKRTQKDLQKSVEYFNKAIEKDPSYALAYAGLADSYVLFSGYNVASPNEAYPKARTAAMKAIEIDETLAEAHTALAQIKLSYEWNFEAAERDFKYAIELNPNYPTARQWYSEYLSDVGRFDEALTQMKRAQELDPLSLIINRELGAILMFKREYDAAIEQYLKTIEIDSSFAPAHTDLGLVYAQKQMYQESISEHQKAINLDPENAFALSNLGYTYAKSGRKDEARKVLNQIQELSARRYVSPLDIASIHAGLGEKDEAFELLEKAYKQHDDDLLFLKVHPPMESLSSDPRFQDLLRKVGLPQ
ncbi:MAG: protein kinase, partial [Acidobacteriota bacterium]|nr:protein kinase [Acidobacteriota bacterium]